MSHNIPIGVSNFEEIRKNSYYYNVKRAYTF